MTFWTKLKNVLVNIISCGGCHRTKKEKIIDENSFNFKELEISSSDHRIPNRIHPVDTQIIASPVFGKKRKQYYNNYYNGGLPTSTLEKHVYSKGKRLAPDSAARISTQRHYQNKNRSVLKNTIFEAQPTDFIQVMGKDARPYFTSRVPIPTWQNEVRHGQVTTRYLGETKPVFTNNGRHLQTFYN